MILDEFTGRNCKRTEYIDARGRHWIVRTDPVFVEPASRQKITQSPETK